MDDGVGKTKVTHRQALEAIKVLGEYCDNHNCYDGECICADIELCPIRTLTAREMRIITKETERLERKEQDNDSVQG